MPEIKILAVASRYPAWAQSAERAYIKKTRSFRVVVDTVRPAASAQKEADKLRARLPERPHLIVLDSGGVPMSSDAFARFLDRVRTGAGAPVFVVGGADGVDKTLLESAHTRLSLSALTFPHALARLILVEQLFRADCLLRRHPYPR